MSKMISFKEKHIAGPPSGQSWVWHTADMRTTEKWRKMPLTCRRLLDRIELEYLAHARQENGRLKIAYSQFEEYGISRRSIPAAIKYAVDAGFLAGKEQRVLFCGACMRELRCRTFGVSGHAAFGREYRPQFRQHLG